MDPIRTVDYHTAGEPFRIVVAGAPDLPGATVADRRVAAMASHSAQWTRQFLGQEPRGHADMYGCFPVPADDAGAALGALFWHKDGFSTACGHGTMALAAWAVDSGLVAAGPGRDTSTWIDVPSGRVLATVRSDERGAREVVFRNVPSFVLHRNAMIRTSVGEVAVDVGFGGAIYASVPAANLGLSVVRERLAALTAVGREIKWEVERAGLAVHPVDPRLSGCYGTTIVDDLGDDERGPHQRSVTVFADGEVDRSPCGSGTSARMALLAEDGRLENGRTLSHDSIIGTTFTARVSRTTTVGRRPAVVTDITGQTYRTGEHLFSLDPADPLGAGFQLR